MTQQESPANLNRLDSGQRIKYPMKKPISHGINQSPAALNPTTTITTHQHHNTPLITAPPSTTPPPLQTTIPTTTILLL
jgi:hypothetical protein